MVRLYPERLGCNSIATIYVKCKTKEGELMKKKIAVLCIVLLIGTSLIACWGSNLESYAMGRSMYYAIEAGVSEETVGRLEDRFNQLLDATAGVVVVEPTQTIGMFSDMAMILAAEVENPYGLMGDLSYLLGDAGAVYTEEGEMLSVRPIPRKMFVAFSMGWKNSKYELAGR